MVLTHVSLFRTCFIVVTCAQLSVSTEQKIITAESGQNISLTCRAPNSNIPVIVVEWSRADLESEYVLLYRDDQFDPEQQHPSFKDRVDLQDRRMKDGDVSLILKNVTTADEGTYECHVIQRGTNRRRRAVYDTEPIKIFSLRVSAPPEQKIITAVSGQNINLTCRAPNNNILVVEWSRADLEPEHVLLYRDDQFDLEEQHPSFRDRVDLQDRQMKDGDVSLILKDVMTDDAGTYECHVFMRGKNRTRAHLKTPPISTITLRVSAPPAQPRGLREDGGKEDVGVRRGRYGLIVSLLVPAVLVVVAAAVWIYRKHKQQWQDLYQHLSACLKCLRDFY